MFPMMRSCCRALTRSHEAENLSVRLSRPAGLCRLWLHQHLQDSSVAVTEGSTADEMVAIDGGGLPAPL